MSFPGNIEIIDYQERYKQNLYDLTVEWLEKYLYLEEEDRLFLNDPEGTVIEKGGFIFFAKAGDELLGTVSLIRKSEKVFELAKLAVTEKAKGKGIGSILMDKFVETAKEQGIETIVLYTNHILIPAIKLYEKYGFQKMPAKENKYLEGDVYMELNLE